jgi:hypothetical protein
MGCLPILLLVIGVAYCADCWPFSRDRWKGWVYPNRGNLSESTFVGDYDRLEDCRAAALAVLRAHHAEITGDYECGRGCKPWQAGMYVCEETVR